jgi:nucleoside-diphosphate-sugar epimerase
LCEPHRPEITLLKRSFSKLGRIAGIIRGVRTFDLDREPLEEVFVGKKYDVVLHCATNYGRGMVSQAQMIESNLLLPLRLLDLATENGTKVFVNTDTMLDKNVSDYTLSKRQFREWLRRAGDHMTCIDMRLEHFYGPGDDKTKFVSNLLSDLLDEQPEIALTEGMQTRDFIYIDDVIEAFLYVLRSAYRQSGYLEYEVGSGHATRLKDFVELARTLCGNTSTYLHYGALPYRANEPMSVAVDVSKLQALGWTSRWSLRDGLQETIGTEQTVRGEGRLRSFVADETLVPNANAWAGTVPTWEAGDTR